MEFNDLIKACESRLRLHSDEYPPSDYEWSIKEVADVDELMEAFKHGNWSKRTGFVLGNLAFIEQVSGGNEWLAVRRENGEWKTFDSISFYNIIERRGEDHCREYINRLRQAELEDGLKALRKLGDNLETVTGGKQKFAGDFSGGVYVRQANDANFGLSLRKQLDMTTGYCKLQFRGFIRKMGGDMSSAELREIAGEADQIAGIISDLEKNPIVVSEEQLAMFANEITARQVEQAITAAAEREPQLDPTMSMM